MNRIEINLRQRVGDLVKAICAKDIDDVMSLYAPDIVSFDLTPIGQRAARYLIDDAFSRLSRSEDASMLCDVSTKRKAA